MVLEMIRWGRLVSRVIAQQGRPRVSKQGLKGLSDYHSSEIAVKTTRRGGQSTKLKGYSHRESPQGESRTIALDLTELGLKATCHNKKELLTLSRVTLKKGVADGHDDDDE